MKSEAPSQPGYAVTVVDAMPRFQEMAKAWNDLLTQSRSDTIFLTWEWLYSWAESFLGADRRLFILQVWHGDALIGIAPWCVRQSRRYGLRYRQIEFLGTPEAGSDYLDVFAQKGHEREVARQIYAFLHQATAEWEGISLRDIPSESLFLLHFLEQSDVDGKYVELQPAAFCPQVILPSSEEDFWAERSSKRRYKWTRERRLLEEKGKLVYPSQSATEVGDGLKRFNDFCQHHGRVSPGLQGFLNGVASRLSDPSWMQIALLSVNQKEIGGCLHLRYRQDLLLFLIVVDRTFDKRISLGNLMLGLNIQKAIAGQIHAYDFLKGTEEYKFHWANHGRRSLTLKVYGKKPTSMLALMEQGAKAIAKTWLRS
jgi:CelD/BcsL family acetyltransferase involved in cellulose biosynthesis